MVYIIQVCWQLVSRSKCFCSQAWKRNGTCHTGFLTACEQEQMLLLASCQQTFMTYTTPLPGYRPPTSWVHYATSCNTQSSAPEDGSDHRPKHVELIGIINKPLLLHLVGVYITYVNGGRSKNINISLKYWGTLTQRHSFTSQYTYTLKVLTLDVTSYFATQANLSKSQQKVCLHRYLIAVRKASCKPQQ